MGELYEFKAKRLRVELEQCKNKKDCTVDGITWVKIPAGLFMMGSNDEYSDEYPFLSALQGVPLSPLNPCTLEP